MPSLLSTTDLNTRIMVKMNGKYREEKTGNQSETGRDCMIHSVVLMIDAFGATSSLLYISLSL